MFKNKPDLDAVAKFYSRRLKMLLPLYLINCDFGPFYILLPMAIVKVERLLKYHYVYQNAKATRNVLGNLVNLSVLLLLYLFKLYFFMFGPCV